MGLTFAKCTHCNTAISVNSDNSNSFCEKCGATIITAEAIKKRNLEVALGNNANEVHYKDRKTRKGAASVACLVLFVLCYFLVEPQLFDKFQDKVTSISLTALAAFILCSVVYSFCTK